MSADQEQGLVPQEARPERWAASRSARSVLARSSHSARGMQVRLGTRGPITGRVLQTRAFGSFFESGAAVGAGTAAGTAAAGAPSPATAVALMAVAADRAAMESRRTFTGTSQKLDQGMGRRRQTTKRKKSMPGAECHHRRSRRTVAASILCKSEAPKPRLPASARYAPLGQASWAGRDGMLRHVLGYGCGVQRFQGGTRTFQGDADLDRRVRSGVDRSVGRDLPDHGTLPGRAGAAGRPDQSRSAGVA